MPSKKVTTQKKPAVGKPVVHKHEDFDVKGGFPGVYKGIKDKPVTCPTCKKTCKGKDTKVRQEKHYVDGKVHLLDERDTSKQASARLVASAVKKSERKGMLDSEAARVLIEVFVDSGPTTTLTAPTTSA